MTILLIAAGWLLLLGLVAGLCAAAQLGDGQADPLANTSQAAFAGGPVARPEEIRARRGRVRRRHKAVAARVSDQAVSSG
jgi:hypothetical protein